MPYSDEESTTTDTTTTSSSSGPRPPILAVDLDETIIQSDTQEVIPGAVDALRKLKELGWDIIIWTCRGDTDTNVPEILERHGVPYDAINDNLPYVNGHSRKIVFDAVVDNKNVDFHDGWESVVRELEKRREGWQDKEITKATIHQLDPLTNEVTIVQEWGLDDDGRAILLSGDPDFLELDIDPDDGVNFLKEAERSVNNTYVWAEVARGRRFLFDPKERAATNFDSSDPKLSAIFEGTTALPRKAT